MTCGPESCGMVPDGCGGQVNCGPCEGNGGGGGGECVSNGCPADACGTQTDNCGDEIDCGACEAACPADSYEENNDQAGARYLGAYDESDGVDTEDFSIEDVSVSADDQDWFHVSLRDNLIGQDPTLDLELTAGDAGLSAAVMLQCVYGDKEADPTCEGGEANGQECDVVVGAGETKSLTVSYNCVGTTNEDAEVYLAFQQSCPDGDCGGVCTSYSVSAASY